MLRLPRLRAIIATLRPSQAYKAAIVFAPALFHGNGSLWVNLPDLSLIALAWVLTSGLVYVVNDLVDLKEDRLRPERADRPLVRGDLGAFQAAALVIALLVILIPVGFFVPHRALPFMGFYVLLNAFYALGLKRQAGVRQGIIAVGFWLRLSSGSSPVTPIPLTAWASIFTLGMAYFLNCLKDGETTKGQRSRWLAAGLAGALTLVALTSLCIYRSLSGTLAHPELPPLLCLISMHRVASHSGDPDVLREQSRSIFKDWVVIGCLIAFAVLMVGQ